MLRPGGRIGISDVVAEDHLEPDERAERGSYVGCIAGALSSGEYAAGLGPPGFEDISVDFTHQVADGMHGAIVKAVKTSEAGRKGLPVDRCGHKRGILLVSARLRRALVAEAIGTFALVFAGCGRDHGRREDAPARPHRVAITFGLVIMFGDLRHRPHLRRALQPGRHVRVRLDPALPVAAGRRY